jgi:hypothetical protein
VIDQVLSASEAVPILHSDAPTVIGEINAFTLATFKTRGGRVGSGMGSLIEAMWVYYMNRTLQNEGAAARSCELAWLQDHEPADFACLYRGAEWEPATRQGELFRIEAKSMNIGVEEAKGHFANLAHETSEHDQLLVLVWSWTTLENKYFWPKIQDYFLGPALPIIRLRDQLHLIRGGSFVSRDSCPDGCSATACTHEGEPLNASGKRERRTGPKSCRPANVDYAANFGGLVRMLKTDSDSARVAFRKIRREDDVAHRYISFIHAHYPAEEVNQYRKGEWAAMLKLAGIPSGNVSSADANRLLREQTQNYQDMLRRSFVPGH